MKSFVLACVVAIILAAIGAGTLTKVQEPVQQAFATSATRVGQPIGASRVID